MSSGETTTDHDTIRAWAEKRGGRPSIVRTAGGRGKTKSGGVLRLDFGEKEENFDEVSWEEFFEVFSQSDLSFLYQETTKDGAESRFNKFIHHTDESHPGKTASAGKGAGEKGSGAKTAHRSPTRPGNEATKAELMEKAREKDVPGRSRMTKEELAKAVA